MKSQQTLEKPSSLSCRRYNNKMMAVVVVSVYSCPLQNKETSSVRNKKKNSKCRRYLAQSKEKTEQKWYMFVHRRFMKHGHIQIAVGLC